MARKQVLVQLDDEQVDALDRLVDPQGSRSELIRAAVDLYLEALREGVDDLRYAQAYRTAPEDLTDDGSLRALALQAWPER